MYVSCEHGDLFNQIFESSELSKQQVVSQCMMLLDERSGVRGRTSQIKDPTFKSSGATILTAMQYSVDPRI